MRNHIFNAQLICLIATVLLCTQTPKVEAGGLYHATSKAAAGNILKKGFMTSRMSAQARFGKGVYLSKTAKTALVERPRAQSIVVLKKKPVSNARLLDIRKMSTHKLKALGGVKNGRGLIKNGVVGPKLGKQIGRFAARTDRPVAFKSARDVRGTNYFIPAKVNKRIGARFYQMQGQKNPVRQQFAPRR